MPRSHGSQAEEPGCKPTKVPLPQTSLRSSQPFPAPSFPSRGSPPNKNEIWAERATGGHFPPLGPVVLALWDGTSCYNTAVHAPFLGFGE